MLESFLKVFQFVQYALVGGSVSLIGYVVMIISGNLGIPEHIAVAGFNFIGVTLTGTINLKTTFKETKVSFWRGLVENNLVRLVMGLIVTPYLMWVICAFSATQTVAYWISLTLSGIISFGILKKIYHV